MADHITRYTDKQAEILAAKLKKVYGQAADEVKRKYAEFEQRHKAIAAKMYKQVQDGTLSLSDYQKWMRGQVFQGDWWKQKIKDITQVYVDADKKAQEIMAKTGRNVFMESANYTAYKLEKDVSGAVSFNVYDKHTVERLLKDNPKMLPEWKIDQPKDYTWNRDRVENALTQGIIQGESIPEIGNRLSTELATSNTKKMNLFARTAMTGAQNAGRQTRLEEATEEGIEVKKQWLATLDNRTRDAHQQLDGQTVGVKDSFHSILGPIKYPGDPDADPANTYNCRCTLVYVYPKYQGLDKGKRREQTTPEGEKSGKVIEDMTYKEWIGEKEQAQENAIEENNSPTWDEIKAGYSPLIDANGKDSDEIRREFKKLCTPLTSEERRDADFYVGSANSFSINKRLRQNPDKSIEEIFTRQEELEGVQKFDALIEKDSLKQDTLLTRLVDESFSESVLGVDYDGLKNILEHFDEQSVQDALQNFIGTSITEYGYLSTAGVRHDRLTAFGGRPIELRLFAKQGTNALIINPSEVEVVLGRGTGYSIRGFSVEEFQRHYGPVKRLIIECEVKGK